MLMCHNYNINYVKETFPSSHALICSVWEEDYFTLCAIPLYVYIYTCAIRGAIFISFVCVPSPAPD